MKRTLSVCAAAALAAGIAMAQTDEWRQLMNDGAAQNQAGDLRAAESSYRHALRSAEAARAETGIALASNALAALCDELGKSAEADGHYRRALALVEKLTGKNSTAYASVLGNMAAHDLDLVRNSQAETLLRQALAIYDRTTGPDDPAAAGARSALADVLLRRGDYRQAEALLESSVSVLEAQSGLKNRARASAAVSNLGVVRHLQRRDDEALLLFQRSVTILESELGPGHPLLIRALSNLAIGYLALGRRDEAGAALRRSLAIARERLGAENPLYGSVLMNYAGFLLKTGQKAEGKALEAQAKTILGDSARRNGAGMTVDVSAFRGR